MGTWLWLRGKCRSRLYLNKRKLEKSHSGQQHPHPRQGRAQYVVLEEEGDSRWGILNIYAPNHAAERRQFWAHIRSHIPLLQ